MRFNKGKRGSTPASGWLHRLPREGIKRKNEIHFIALKWFVAVAVGIALPFGLSISVHV
jgi:hypothetical protein